MEKTDEENRLAALCRELAEAETVAHRELREMASAAHAYVEKALTDAVNAHGSTPGRCGVTPGHHP
jgi:hypothetical protein